MSEAIKKPANAQSLGSRTAVFGVAINDSPYLSEVKIGGKRVFCPAQRAWRDMLRRCFDAAYQEKYPTYKGCKVCDEWMVFTGFLSWWEKNKKDGYQLDKDLIGNGKIYSPSTCVYVPPWLNSFLNDCAGAGSETHVGVFRRESGRYQANCSQTILGGPQFIGSFDTEQEAIEAWKGRKLSIAFNLKSSMDEIDERIYHRVTEIIERQK